MIAGVQITPLTRHADNRGYLVEVAKSSTFPSFTWRQTNFTVAHPGVIKAFHWHTKQTDLWFCTSGNLEAVLFDRRANSPTFKQTQTIAMGEMSAVAVLIPPGVAHGYRVLGNSPAGLVYLVDQEYDPKKPDEERIAHDDPEIGFSWETKPR